MNRTPTPIIDNLSCKEIYNLLIRKQAVCVTKFDQSERVICGGIFELGKSCFEKCVR